ncbi:MAG: TRAP transporter permease [Pseudomonadota bacterium]
MTRIASPFDAIPGPVLLRLLFGVLAVVYVAGHVVQVQSYVLPAGQFKIWHVGGAVLLIALALAGRSPSRLATLAHLALAALAAFTIAYVFAEHDQLTSRRSFIPNTTDLCIAALLLALCLYTSMREWGWIVSALAVLGLLYGYYGDTLPEGIFYHGGLSLRRLLSTTSIPFFNGLLGGLSELSAGTIFPFMLFAAALHTTGCVTFIMQAAYRMAGRTRAGPAQIAVISSGFMGMVSGSSVANVASTGALTIPLMKRVGFRPEFAGAVEAVASTGGQITPPVMGLAAFLIVGLTGIPYGDVIVAAALPALITYLYLMFAVHLRAVKAGLDATGNPELAREFEGTDTLGRLSLRHLHFFVAVGWLVWRLLETNLAGRSAMEATALLLALFVLRELATSWRGLASILGNLLVLIGRTAADAALKGAQVAVVVAVIGVLVDILAVTGFAQKLSFAMLELAGGDLVLLLLVAALACLAFGLGLPTSAAYILVALLGAPALVNLGVPLLAAHFFVFFFANASAITPPVAICCLVAAKIADAGFFRTSFIAVRLGLPGFILPFLFVAHPELLGIDTTLAEALLIAAMALAGVIALNVVLEGHLFAPLHWGERVALLPAALGLLHPSLWASVVGLALFALIALRQIRAQRAQAGISPG